MGNVRWWIVGILSWVCLVSGVAQNTGKAEIARIKKSDDYIYAEATRETLEDAKDLATEMLYNEINEWVASEHKLKIEGRVMIQNSRSAWQEISLPRGNMFRAFLYVKKSDVFTDGNAVEDVTQLENVPSENKEAAVDFASQQPDVIKQLMKVKVFSELRPLVTSFKAQGKIREYNLFTKLNDASEYYLVINNRQQEVVALLTPGKDVRINLLTGQEDKTSNYDWHGATIAIKVE